MAAVYPPTARPTNVAQNVLTSSLSQATSSKAAEGRRRGGGAQAREVHALAQEVQVFRYLCRVRSKQYDDLRRRACDLEGTADEADSELVYALDRAEFAQSQLYRLVNESPSRNASELLKLTQDTDAQLKNHLRSQEEMQDRREHVARIMSHLRVIRCLCSLNEMLPGLNIDPNLVVVLEQCEAKLRDTWNNDAELEQLASEIYELSPLHALIPLIINTRRSGDDSAVPPSSGQDQWLLPAQRAAQKSGHDEDALLQSEIAQLTDRNEVLRRELSEEAARHDAFENEEKGALESEMDALRETELWQGKSKTKIAETEELQSEVASLEAEMPQLEKKAATARLQLGCERSTVAKQSEEIVRCRAAVPALTRQLRQLVTPDAGSHERQANLLHLRKELAEAYAALAAEEAKEAYRFNAFTPEDDVEDHECAIGSPGEIGHLERKLEVQRAVNAGLKQAVEARNGSMKSQAKQTESRNDLIAKVAKNSKEIAVLKDQVRNAEMREGIVMRQESRAGVQPLTSPGDSSRSSHGSSPCGNRLLPSANGVAGATVQLVADVKTVAAPTAPSHAVANTVTRIVSGGDRRFVSQRFSQEFVSEAPPELRTSPRPPSRQVS